MAIYQCYFAKSQEVRLFKNRPYTPFGLEPRINPKLTTNCPELELPANRLQLCEYAAMLHLWRNPPSDPDSWIGFTSYRQFDKFLGLITPRIAKNIPDLLTKNEYLGWYFRNYRQTLVEQGEMWHPGITNHISKILRIHGLSIPPSYELSRPALFANYWIMRKETFVHWMNWSWPMIVSSITTHQKDAFMQSTPKAAGYVAERLFIIYCDMFNKHGYNLAPKMKRAIYFRRLYWSVHHRFTNT